MTTPRPRPRRRPTVPTSTRDLAMLRLAPIDAVPLPRAHVSPRQAAGMLRVLDRAAGAEVIVYTPAFRTQFASGHRSGRWYVREATTVGGAPRSIAFATAREAVEAVSADSWRLRVVSPDEPSAAPAGPSRPRLRIYWGRSELSA